MNYFKASVLLTLLLTFLVLYPSCTSKSHRIERNIIDYLPGEWLLPAHAKGFRTYVEKWTRDNDSTFSGVSSVLNTKTEALYNEEFVWIKYRNGAWRFIADPKYQEQIEYTLTEVTGNKVRFENHDQDIPKYIQYTWYSMDTILAEVGDTATLKIFNMIRVQD